MSTTDDTGAPPVEEQKAPESKPNPDTEKIVNKLAEFDRKLGRVMSQMEQRQAAQAPAPKDDADSLSDILFEDEGKFVDKIADTVSRRVAKATQSQSELSSAVNWVGEEFPDAVSEGTPLNNKIRSQLAEWGYNDFSEVSGRDLKAAAGLAAIELDIKAKSKQKVAKRSEDSDVEDFSLDNDVDDSSSNDSRRKTRRSNKVDDGTLAWAEKLGLDVNDEKQIERLKKRAQRTFGSYKAVKE